MAGDVSLTKRPTDRDQGSVLGTSEGARRLQGSQTEGHPALRSVLRGPKEKSLNRGSVQDRERPGDKKVQGGGVHGQAQHQDVSLCPLLQEVAHRASFFLLQRD